MYSINFINESQNLTISNYVEQEDFIRRVFALAYNDGSNYTYRSMSPKLLSYYDQSNPKAVSDYMRYVNDLYGIPEGDLLFYRTIVCDDTWFDSRTAFGLSAVVQNCYSQHGFITATTVQLLKDNVWCIHIIVDKVNRYNGEVMGVDTVNLKRAIDYWYNYRAQKTSLWY